MATRVEKQTLSGTDVVVGYGVVSIPTYNEPVPPATTGTTTYSSQDVVVDVEIDYSAYYERIATALETIATNSLAIKNNLDTIATKQTTIADKQTTIADKTTAMETYQKKLKELGEGAGIRAIGPFEAWGNISTYKFLIEQAKVLDTTNAASEDLQNKAIAEVQRYLDLINARKSF
jgi:hypothetical protein